MHKLAIVIVSYNAAPYLELTLKSVEKALQQTKLSTDVWLVDNNSDENIKAVTQQFEWLNCIFSTKNQGFSTGNNQAIEKINSEYILLLNPDTLISEDCLTECIQFADTKNDFGALSVRMIDFNGIFHPESKRNNPSILGSFLKILKLNQLFKNYSIDYYANHIQEFDTAKVEVLCGAFMFIKTKVYREVGGLDNDYFMYGEDIDLSYKINQSGSSVWYKGNLSIVHFKGESTVKNKSYVNRFYGAMEIFIKKHYRKKTNFILFQMMLFFIRLKIKWESLKLNYRTTKSKRKLTLKEFKWFSKHTKNEVNQNIIFDFNTLNSKEIINFIVTNPKKTTHYAITCTKKWALGSGFKYKI